MFQIILIFADIATVSATSGVSSAYENDTPDNIGIVGGRTVTNRSEFPYQVSLRLDNSHFCGGVIIDERHILTAAHCSYYPLGRLLDPDVITVVAGDLNLTSPSNTTVVKYVQEMYINIQFNFDTLAYDVAVWKLTTNFTFNSNVNKVNLATSTPPDNTTCTVSGWGFLNETLADVSPALQEVSLALINRQACNQSYNGSVEAGMICAGLPGKDACHGDSGGPLVCNSTLVGLVSWGYGCARKGYPGVYTEVTHYRRWILSRVVRDDAIIDLQISWSDTLVSLVAALLLLLSVSILILLFYANLNSVFNNMERVVAINNVD